MKIEKLNYQLTSHGTIILNEPIVQYHWKILNHKMFSLNDIYFAAHKKRVNEKYIIEDYELAKNHKWPTIEAIEPKQYGHYGVYQSYHQKIRIIKIKQELIARINIRGPFSKNKSIITRTKNITTTNIKDVIDELHLLKLTLL